MPPDRGSVRRHVHIRREAADVWAVVGDPARIQDWFPGIAASTVEGTTRIVTTADGRVLPEEIVTDDQLQRRFQYRLAVPFVREHLSTLDVIDLGDGTTVVVYGVDAVPATLALVIGGAAGSALEHLRTIMEGT